MPGKIPFVLRRFCGKIKKYPGVAQLVARVIWERSAGIRTVSRADAGKPCSAYVCGLSPLSETRRENAFDHRNDHRQRKFQKEKIEYPGVAQLVARVVWDHPVYVHRHYCKW
jgi:hypothetical protein